MLDAPVRTNLEEFHTRLIRESMPIWAAYLNVTGAFTAGGTIGALAPSPGTAWWIDSIVVSASEALDLQLAIASTAITPSGVINPLYRVTLAAGVPLVIPVNRFVQEKFSVAATSSTALGSGTSTFRMGLQGYAVANDFAYEYPKTMLVVGDSISHGTGVTYGEQMYHWKLRDWLISRGQKYRMVQKGRGSWTSTHAEAARAMQMYNVSRADLILYNLGMNDTASTDYTNTNLPAFIAWKQQRFPQAKLIVLGPSPRQDAAEASVLAPIRAAASAAVVAAADPTVFYCSLGSSFATGDDTYYFTGDGTISGERVHPNTAGHTAMFNTLSAFVDSNNIG